MVTSLRGMVRRRGVERLVQEVVEGVPPPLVLLLLVLLVLVLVLVLVLEKVTVTTRESKGRKGSRSKEVSFCGTKRGEWTGEKGEGRGGGRVKIKRVRKCVKCVCVCERVCVRV